MLLSSPFSVIVGRADPPACGIDRGRATGRRRVEEGVSVLAQMRQARILEELHRTGGVRVSNLTEMLGVSDMRTAESSTRAVCPPPQRLG